MKAFIGAISAEVEALLALVQVRSQISVAGVLIYQVQYQEETFLLVHSGCGKIAATQATTILLERFPQVCEIINFGICGSLSERLHVLDVLIVTGAYQYDFDLSYLESDFVTPYINTDHHLNHQLQSLGITSVTTGEILTGDLFVGEETKLQTLRQQFPQAVACDMESYAIIQVARNYGIPATVLRVVSDETVATDSYAVFQQYLHAASTKVSQMILSYLRAYPS